MKIQVDDFLIGEGEPTFIIAEAGLNHNGDFNLAKKLISKASNIGVNCVKFQIFKVDEIFNQKHENYALFKSLELSNSEWIELADFAKSNGVLFTASVFGKESADLVEIIGSPIYKIASGDLTNLPLLSYIAKKGKPIILSTGMSSICEIEEALKVIRGEGNQKIVLMHCVSNYPAKYNETNIKTIQTLKNTFKIPTGFSDHTEGTLIPSIAVSLGANLIEKHFTLDNNLQGPDHKLSLEPSKFKKMIENIRNVEKAFGDGVKNPTDQEKNLANLARRSLTAAEDIKEGDVISIEKVNILRPQCGIEPKFLNVIIGRKSKKDISKDEPITWNSI